MRAALLPSARMRRAPDGRATSRLGGEPSLPPELEWPAWRGRPLGFLAQVELAEVPRLEPAYELPQEGVLSLFYPVDAQGQPWGFDPGDAGSARVL